MLTTVWQYKNVSIKEGWSPDGSAFYRIIENYGDGFELQWKGRYLTFTAALADVYSVKG